jgi:hypothetical protein
MLDAHLPKITRRFFDKAADSKNEAISDLAKIQVWPWDKHKRPIASLDSVASLPRTKKPRIQ